MVDRDLELLGQVAVDGLDHLAGGVAQAADRDRRQPNPVIAALKALDIEALTKLYELQKKETERGPS